MNRLDAKQASAAGASWLERPTVLADPNKGFYSRGMFVAAGHGRAAPIRARTVRSDSPKSEPALPFMEAYT